MSIWKPPMIASDSVVRRIFDSLSKHLKDRGMPPGSFYPTILSTAPTAHVFMYGQTIVGAESIHPELWENVDPAWKSGSNLLVPDMRGRTVFGLDNMGGSDAGILSTANTMGTTMGAETVTLIEANLPAHVHSIPGGGAGGTPGVLIAGTTAAGAGNTGSTGSGTAVNKMPPGMTANWILKVD